jgi:hypothetical protein
MSKTATEHYRFDSDGLNYIFSKIRNPNTGIGTNRDKSITSIVGFNRNLSESDLVNYTRILG